MESHRRQRCFFSILTVIALVFLLVVPASAAGAETADADLRQSCAELEQKYGIRILYSLNDSDTPMISKSTLRMLDTSLGYVTPEVVRQVAAHYRDKVGNPLIFSFEYTSLQTKYAGLEVVGYFEEETATIRLLLPYTSNGTFTTGAAPLTIVHEFGHALHTVCADLLGAGAIESEWRALGGDIPYNDGFLGSYRQSAFITSYAASSYVEDFAETFAHGFVRNKAGQGFSSRLMSDGSYTVLGRKVRYLEELLPRAFGQAEPAVENLHRIFSTPAVLDYQGLLLSGEDLQFIGFSAPRYVRSGILKRYGLEQNEYRWIREIGGWQVETADGSYYLIFPGGSAAQLSQPLQTAA